LTLAFQRIASCWSGGQEGGAGLLAAAARLGADPAVLVHRGVLLALTGSQRQASAQAVHVCTQAKQASMQAVRAPASQPVSEGFVQIISVASLIACCASSAKYG
jgi:hypothetical protein